MGCPRLGFERAHIDMPPAPTTVAALRPGQDDLTSVLALIGAPTFLWTLEEHGGNGFFAVYASSSQLRWAFRITDPFARQSASFDYANDALALDAVVLFFDSDWALQRVEQGLLADFRPGDTTLDWVGN